jgi:hypothetical protein
MPSGSAADSAFGSTKPGPSLHRAPLVPLAEAAGALVPPLGRVLKNHSSSGWCKTGPTAVSVGPTLRLEEPAGGSTSTANDKSPRVTGKAADSSINGAPAVVIGAKRAGLSQSSAIDWSDSSLCRVS